ncbi:MAG: chromosomal replication initiator protein DnaA [Firmicutes bacterium]|nr:chromosomal replication initiator protein DnaA [Bacillota bacterium]
MNAAKELWQKMLTALETEVSAVNFDVWIKTLEPINILDGKLILCASNAQVRNFVCDKFRPMIMSAMSALNPYMTDVVLIDPSERESVAAAEETFVIDEPEPPARIEANVLSPRYNFESFVVGKSNRHMYEAARAVAEQPGVQYNPLFIYGGTGLGKTHIMHAIGNYVRIKHPHLKVLYAGSEKFVNEYIESVRTTKGKSSNFREKYRGVDVLMIDDIQFIVGKQGSQEEMFNTFNELHQAGKQLIFTSDRPPQEMDIEERLISRFQWGLLTDVVPPDFELRVAILHKKAQLEKFNIPGEVLSYIAERVQSNVRAMESILNKVNFLSRLNEQEPSIETVTEALKDYSDKNEEFVTAERVIYCTCKYYNVRSEDLTGKKKNREIVEPRQVCIYLITELLSLPLASIGSLFGGRDHTTVMHARDKIAGLVQSNIKIKVAVSDIKEMVLKRD